MRGYQLRKTSVVVVSGRRTPFGNLGGAFSKTSATDLGVVASKAAMKDANLSPKDIDHVFFGNVLQTSANAAYCARHIGLKAGIPKEVPALTVNRLCASGFQAIVSGAEAILFGQADVVLAGGTENLSMAPYVVRGAREGLRLGHRPFLDSLWEIFLDEYSGLRMGETAENLAGKHGITRKASDEFSLLSQRRTKEAQEKGVFKDEIAPVDIQTRKGVLKIEEDEHPRPNADPDSLAKLRPVFDSKGIVTAGSSSGICDGAAALVLMSEDAAKKRKIKPLGRLVANAVTGVDPDFMGIGPVPATQKALKEAQLTMDHMDLFEVNEAFAPQVLAVEKELGILREKLNVNGGAIALGHPLGASGARLALTLLLELRRRGKSYGLASACIGGGQGMSLIVEAL